MAITLLDVINQTRRFINDKSQGVWTDDDIKAFINEAIPLIRKTVPNYFDNLNLVRVTDITDVINIPEDYENLLSLFASARCFEQDEQTSRGIQKMNEFESRKMEMEVEIRDSQEYADLLESTGETDMDYVRDTYEDVSENIIGLE